MTNAADVKAGDVIRTDDGLETVVAAVESRGFDKGRERLWIHHAPDGAEVIGRSIYWGAEALYRRGEVVGNVYDESES